MGNFVDGISNVYLNFIHLFDCRLILEGSLLYVLRMYSFVTQFMSAYYTTKAEELLCDCK